MLLLKLQNPVEFYKYRLLILNPRAKVPLKSRKTLAKWAEELELSYHIWDGTLPEGWLQ